MQVEDTLNERGAIYGDYGGIVKFRAEVMSLIKQRHKDVNNSELTAEQEIVFGDILMKLGRLAATPSHKDSWHDLAGYALIIEEIQ